MKAIRPVLFILFIWSTTLLHAAEDIIVNQKNIYVGMQVFKNPKWDANWGQEEIHPPADVIGTVRSWSDMEGKLHGQYQNDEKQLQWPGLACVDWEKGKGDAWKNTQAYRIGFANEYWLASKPKEDETNK